MIAEWLAYYGVLAVILCGLYAGGHQVDRWRDRRRHAGHGCSRDQSLTAEIDLLERELGVGWERDDNDLDVQLEIAQGWRPDDFAERPQRHACEHRDVHTVTLGTRPWRRVFEVCRTCGAKRTRPWSS